MFPAPEPSMVELETVVQGFLVAATQKVS